MPLIAYSGERPRRLSPDPLSFSLVGEKDGKRAETASTVEPDIRTCRSSVSLSMTSTVRGRALAGNCVRAAVTIIGAFSLELRSLSASSCPTVWASAGVERTSARAPVRYLCMKTPSVLEGATIVDASKSQ